MRLSKRGFTLVELLVVIVILGIISAMSFVMIRRVSYSWENKKYETYRSGLSDGAKLYTDSYSYDMFGHLKSGCAYITYKELESKKLAKDIGVNDVTCDTDKTYVKVIKLDNKYTYDAYLACGKREGDKVTISKKLPKDFEEMNNDTCGYGKSTMEIDALPKTNALETKQLDVDVSIKSSTGIMNNPIINYGWSSIKDVGGVTSWTKLKFKIPSLSAQEDTIFNDLKRVEVTQSIKTPPKTGDYYLVVAVESLSDMIGTEFGPEKYVYFGPYKLDNTPPEFGTSSGVYFDTNDTTYTPKLKLDVFDETAPKSALKMCFSYDNDTCIKTSKIPSSYKKVVSSTNLKSLANGYDGSVKKVHVTAVDRAGNYKTKLFTYQPTVKFKLTYNSDGGSSCAAITGIAGKKWGTLCTPTRSGYEFGGWYTGRNGAGTLVTANTMVTKNLTVYAKWKKINTFTVTFVYQNNVHLWNGGAKSVKKSCTTTGSSCSVSTPQLAPFPGRSGCGNYYSNLFYMRGWSTNSNATNGTTGSVSTNGNLTYYSIVVPNSTYTASKMFTVSHYTCDNKTNGSSKNVYNRSAAKNGSLLENKSYIVEGHSFTWNGSWAINSGAYKKCANPSSDVGDCEWLYLVGQGGLCRKGKDKAKNNLKSCPGGSYIKATQLKF